MYQHASSYLLASLEAVYHGALNILRIVNFLHIIVYYIIELPGLHLLFEGKCYSGFFAILSLLFDSPKSSC